MKESAQSEHCTLGTRVELVRNLCRFALAVPVVLTLLTQTAYADAGTPLMFLEAGFLFFGNAIIGVVEGLALALIFRAGFIRCILIMVLANYLSGIAGILGIESAGQWATSVSINNLRFAVLTLAAMSFLVTIVVEWPFCYWALKGKDRRRFHAISASALVNTASYAVLIPVYLSVSSTSLIFDASVTDVAAIARNYRAQVYYLSADKGELRQVGADGSKSQRIRALDSGMVDPELTVCSVAGKTRVAVLWRQWTQGKEGLWGQSWKVAIDSIPESLPACKPCDSVGWGHWSERTDLRLENERDWEVRTGDWAADGLSAVNKKSGKKVWFALETPLLQWRFSNANLLPGDQVICQLGTQIVLIDLNTRRIGLIAIGVSPVVMLER